MNRNLVKKHYKNIGETRVWFFWGTIHNISKIFTTFQNVLTPTNIKMWPQVFLGPPAWCTILLWAYTNYYGGCLCAFFFFFSMFLPPFLCFQNPYKILFEQKCFLNQDHNDRQKKKQFFKGSRNTTEKKYTKILNS